MGGRAHFTALPVCQDIAPPRQHARTYAGRHIAEFGGGTHSAGAQAPTGDLFPRAFLSTDTFNYGGRAFEQHARDDMRYATQCRAHARSR